MIEPNEPEPSTLDELTKDDVDIFQKLLDELDEVQKDDDTRDSS